MEKIHLFFQRFWTGLMVFKPLLVKGLTLWNYKWTCALMRWSQESPRLKKMCLTFIQALIYHHRRHHHLSFLLFNITSTLFSSCVFGYIIMLFEQFTISLFAWYVWTNINYVIWLCGFYIFDLFMVLASWFGLYFSMNVVWMLSCIWMLQTCYALWLFVDAKGGEK